MMKLILPFLLFLGLPVLLWGQYNAPQNKVWTMGYHAGLDFTGSNPVTISSNIQSFEGCASACDAMGTLKLYTDGNTVWNGSGTVVQFGNIINGGSNNTTSTTQGAVIVPDPGNNNRYYIFSITFFVPNTNCGRLYCNRVDLSLNNGIGAVDTGFSLRGIVLADSLTEKMLSIDACNGSAWVVTTSRNSPKFLSFNVNSLGVIANPVISTPGGTAAYYTFNVMKASPDKTKIMAAGETGLGLYDFNSDNGVVSNSRVITDTGTGYGGAFSPDGTKFYCGSYQYDLSAANPGLTKTKIGILYPGDMRLAPDGKIYLKSTVQQTFTFFARINNPNAAGLACNFQDSVTSLSLPLNGLTFGLPQEVVVPTPPAPPITDVVLDTVLCKLPPGGFNLFTTGALCIWDDGSSAAVRNITEDGIYWVMYNDRFCFTKIDTFIIKGIMPPVSIVYNNPVLSTSENYSSYQWYKNGQLLSGATNPTLSATGLGVYSVIVGNEWGCKDSTGFQVTTVSIEQLPDVLRSTIKVYPNPASQWIKVDAPVLLNLSLYNMEGKQLLGSKLDNKLDVSSLAEGLYFIRMETKDGQLIKVEKVTKLQH